MVTGKPVKWMEDRSENLISTGFARDYIMRGEIAATRDGKILAIRTNVLADHGAFNGTAAPMKYPAGFFGVFTGSYDIEAAYCTMTAVYTNKAPGGVAYACSFRITEAVYLVERMVDCLADELEMDPVELRLQNLLRPEQFPYTTKTGWVYDSGDYEPTLREALRIAGYDELRREQAEKRARGELMGIGVSFFTEAVGAGPRKDMDILGLGMADGCELRVHPTGKAVVRVSVQTQGQGHETTFAQIVAEEIGIPPADIEVVHGDTDQTPFGLGTYGSRSTPVSGAAAALVARKVRDKARLIAVRRCSRSRSPTSSGTRAPSSVTGDPAQSVTIQDIAMRAHGAGDLPDGVEGGLEAQICYNPANLTYPFGAYICVVDVDPGTAEVKVRRFIAVDDCGTRINPMIIEGQVHGGLTDGVGMALMEMIAFDEDGNCLGGSLMDYLHPDRARGARLGDRIHRDPVAAPPDRRQGRRRVGDRRLAAGRRQRRRRRAQAVRRPARRHAADPVAGVGRHAGPSRRRRSERGTGAMPSLLTERIERTRRRRGCRSSRPTVVRAQEPTLGPAGRRRDHPGRRLDRGLRRRPVRRGVGAGRRARRAGRRRDRAAAGAAGRRGGRSRSRPAPGSW